MPRILVYDAPTRIFHWLFAVGLIAAVSIAWIAGEHSAAFGYHAIIGLVLALMVLLRIVWGFVGTRHARFRALAFRLGEVVEYFRGVIRGGGRKYVGHNPASGYAALVMLALSLVVVASGLIMVSGGGKVWKEVHEIATYTLIAVAGVHVIGVIVHTIRHRENITMSMVSGRKTGEESDAIASARAVAAVVLVAAGALCAGVLVRGYDAGAQRVTVPLLGVSLQVGEGEHEDEHERGHDPGRRGGHEDREHDDD